jgi:hypothetical protein
MPGRPAVRDLRRSRRVRFQSNPIIHRIAEALFATQVPLRRLHRDVPEKELNLLQFSTRLLAKTGANPAEVVRRERLDLTVFCSLLHDTSNDLGTESRAPNPASFVDRTKEGAGCNPGGPHPGVNSSFHPIRGGNGSYVATVSKNVKQLVIDCRCGDVLPLN